MSTQESPQSRNLRRLDPASKRLGLLLFALLTAACDHSSPTGPTPPPTLNANVAIASISIAGEHAATGGFVYRTVIRLRETAGAAATIKAVDLTFVDGANVVMSSHHEDPIPATANVCPASGTVNTRELMTVDADTRHPYATTVQARVAYTDGTATEQVANASSNVPPLTPPPPPTTYTLGGIISDETGRGIAGARVEILNGANAGVVATTDGTGAYSMTGLLADAFRMRASAESYDPGEQGVTVPANPRADFTLRRHISPPSTYTLGGIVTDETGRGIAGARVEVLTGANAGLVATTDGTGAYALAGLLADSFRLRASADSYDPAEQGVTVPANRRADFTLRRRVESCAYTIAPAGPVDVPQPGGQFSVAITRVSGTCGWQAAADVGWIALTRTSGAATDTLTYTVALNPTFVGRLGVITIAWAGGSARLTVRQANDWPAFCVGTITVGGQSSIAVPASGGQFTALIAAVPGMPPGLCSTWTASVNGPITLVGPNTGLTPAQLTFTVPPNSVAQPRVLSVSIRWDSPSSSTAQLTVNQSGTP